MVKRDIRYLFIEYSNLPSFLSSGARSTDECGPSNFFLFCCIILMARALVAACGAGVGKVGCDAVHPSIGLC
jgi:hypothetical protein